MVAVLLASVATAVVAQAAPASAAGATCIRWTGGYGDLCIHFRQDYSGSLTGMSEDKIPNYPSDQTEAQRLGLVYKSSGTGQGQRLGNNNGSVRNLDSVCYQMLWYSTNYTGYSYGLGLYPNANHKAGGSQLGNLLNNLRSHRIYNC